MVSLLAITFFHPLMPTYDHDAISVKSDIVFDPLSYVGLHPLDAFRLSLDKINQKQEQAPPTNTTNMTSSSNDHKRVRANKGSQC